MLRRPRPRRLVGRTLCLSHHLRPRRLPCSAPVTAQIDDCTFHRCVRLGKFDAERTITFIPPDGEFELMRYRVTDNINLPFKLLPAIQEMDKSHVSIALKASANFSNKLYANNFVVKIPTPPNTAKCKVSVGSGRAKFEADQRAIVWRIKKFVGNSEFTLTADVELMTTSRAKTWSRPPISVEFQVPMFTASGVHVRFLRVYDKSGYQTARWVRYLTKAGGSSALSPPRPLPVAGACMRSLTRAPAVARPFYRGGNTSFAYDIVVRAQLPRARTVHGEVSAKDRSGHAHAG